MNRKGASYDVGQVMGFNWRPSFDPKIVRRELEIIKNDLHSNAVRICGLENRQVNGGVGSCVGSGIGSLAFP